MKIRIRRPIEAYQVLTLDIADDAIELHMRPYAAQLARDYIKATAAIGMELAWTVELGKPDTTEYRTEAKVIDSSGIMMPDTVGAYRAAPPAEVAPAERPLADVLEPFR